MPDSKGGSARGSRSRHDTLRSDAIKRDIAILPPDRLAHATWRAIDDKTLVAGWSQIPGIGEKVGARIATARSQDPDCDLTDIKGIGPKTVDKINEFCNAEDPFDIYKLEQNIKAIKEQIESGELDVPMPTHSAEEAVEAPGREEIVFLGSPTYRNLRDIFEANRAKTGEALDESQVRNPHLREWVMMSARDSEEIVTLCFSRKKYPHFRDVIWKIDLNSDLVLIRGKKAKMGKGKFDGATNRVGLVYVDDLWVIDPKG